MKKQIKLNWQTITFAAIVSLVIMFAGNSSAIAQTTYKVGDRAETMSAGEWVEVEIIKVQDNGDYLIRYVKTGISGAWAQAKHLRPIKADAQTDNQNNADNKTQNQTNGNTQTTTVGGTVTTRQNNSIFERYGSREPRTCEDTKSPAKVAITAELAKKYFICKAEGLNGNLLYLVENVKLEVGGPVPYDPTLGAFEAINVRVPLYPIRGSYLRYQCKNLINEHVGAPDTNCNTYNQPKATGYCYKTTFGDWSCFMADRSNKDENWRRGIAPPK